MSTTRRKIQFSRFRASFRQDPVTTRCERRISQGGVCRQFGRVCCCGFVIYIWCAYTLCSICVLVVFVILLVFKWIVLDEMFVSFCLIAKYPWVLNKLSLNCGIGPGSPFGAKPFPKPMMTWNHLCKYATTTTTKSRKANDINIHFYTNIGHLQRPHILNVHL